MNVLSLFDGISCGQLALKAAGVEVSNYYASEIDPHAIRVTQHHFPNTIQLGSVLDVKGGDLPKIDLLIGGSPCQGFSFAGKMLNFEDPRSKLFFEFVRLLKECAPRHFLLENVNMKAEHRNVISDLLGVQPVKINSSLVSAAKRNRLYWTNIPNVSLPAQVAVTFDDIHIPSETWMEEEKVLRISNWKAQQKPLKSATLIGSGAKLPCLTARGYNQYHSGMVLITDGKRYRYLSNEEAEAAHNLPKGYTSICDDRERSRMIGNGWTVNVIAHIFRGLKGENC